MGEQSMPDDGVLVRNNLILSFLGICSTTSVRMASSTSAWEMKLLVGRQEDMMERY